MATYLMAMYNAHSTPNASATYAIQSLYEKGLITYPRTDSKRISSKEFINSTTNFINKNYGSEYFDKVPEVKSKKKVQDAHEAIRPVDISKTPDSIVDLKLNEKRAYKLI
jgi:DNA topoisomerase-1